MKRTTDGLSFLNLEGLSPEEKLAVHVIWDWVVCYKRWVEKQRCRVERGGSPKKGALWEWVDDGAEFWIRVIGGSLEQLRRFRDELWEKEIGDAEAVVQKEQEKVRKRIRLSKKQEKVIDETQELLLALLGKRKKRRKK